MVQMARGTIILGLDIHPDAADLDVVRFVTIVPFQTFW
jgi:hypothetical protein